MKRDPTNAAYRNNLAAALTKIGDFNAAKAACEKVSLTNRPLPSSDAVLGVFRVEYLILRRLTFLTGTCASPSFSSLRGSPQALELDSKYVKAWAKKGDIEFFMKEYHKALDSYKMVGQAVDSLLLTRK